MLKRIAHFILIIFFISSYSSVAYSATNTEKGDYGGNTRIGGNGGNGGNAGNGGGGGTGIFFDGQKGRDGEKGNNGQQIKCNNENCVNLKK